MKNNRKILDIKKIKKEAKGITLIALVVTIIVLLILAAVAINLTIGNNGIFTRAGNATQKWEEASKNEQDEMDNVSEVIDEFNDKEDDEGKLKLKVKSTFFKDGTKLGCALLLSTSDEYINVNWGDGNVEQIKAYNEKELPSEVEKMITNLIEDYGINRYNIVWKIHEYKEENKDYLVTIDGNIKNILPQTKMIVEVINWGENEYERILLSGNYLLEKMAEPNEDNFKNIKSFMDSFWDCENLKEIPNNFFEYSQNAESYAYCFNGCTNLTGVVPKIWEKKIYKEIEYGDFFTTEEELQKLIEYLYNNEGMTEDEIGLLYYKAYYYLAGCFGYCEKITNYNEMPSVLKIKEHGS